MSASAGSESTRAGGEDVELEVRHRCSGRIVLAEASGTLHLGRSYEIHRSDDGGRSWAQVTSVPSDPLRRLATSSRLLSRLGRLEVRALARTHDGGYVASSRQGVFVARPGERRMRPAFVETGAVPLLPPMRISRGPGGRIVWGEYGSSKGRAMRLFASCDGGESFQMVQSLAGILHIHNVIWDSGQDHYWVLSGDFDPQPGIGRLSADLERFEWFVKGEQRYRAVEVFDLGDRLVYATDSQLEPNALMSLDKATGKAERLREFSGSCIYACRFGGIYALTTSVEPSAVNRAMDAELWISRDAVHWKRAWRSRKDRWNADYFQFGSVVLPSGATDEERIVFSGQALQGIDGKTVVARLAPGSVL